MRTIPLPSLRGPDFTYGSRFDRVVYYVLDRDLVGIFRDLRKYGARYVLRRLKGWPHVQAKWGKNAPFQND